MTDFPPFAGIYTGDWIADRTRGEVRELRAEVERVYSERNDAVDELVLLRDERAAALAEVERLKALLREHGIEDVQSLPRTETPR